MNEGEITFNGADFSDEAGLADLCSGGRAQSRVRSRRKKYVDIAKQPTGAGPKGFSEAVSKHPRRDGQLDLYRVPAGTKTGESL
jgi:hypothetical protein